MRVASFPSSCCLFVGSGCAALIYEVVWFQLLQLVIGSSAISLAVLLGTFMGGLCLGSLGYSRVAPARRHPLRMYALLEVGIGVIGLLVLVAMPIVGSAYSSWAGPGTLGVVLRALAAGVCLLPPTLLMGATLPALSRWIEMTPRGVSWLGFFYAGNTAGAVIGSVLAGFYLLRVLRPHHRHLRGRRAECRRRRRGLPGGVRDRVRSAGHPGRVGTAGRRRRAAGRRGRTRVDPGLARRAADGLSGDRALRLHRALGRSRVDATALAALRRHDLHVLAHPRRASCSASGSAAASARRSRATSRARRPRWAGARRACAPRWRGPAS